jgi:hypothetical protein
LASAVGWVVLLTLGWRVGLRLGESLIGNGPIGAVVGMLIGGLILGVAQWLVLRPLLIRPIGWVVATVVGVGLGTVVGLVADSAAPAVAGLVGPVVLAIALGVAQWLVLRSAVPRAGWWVVATIGSLLLAFLLYLLVRSAIDERGVTGLLVDAVAGLIYGIGTSLAWVWLGRVDAASGSQQPATS